MAPRSPDLNPCDFFKWGHMKQMVDAEAINSEEELCLRVKDTARIIP
jgi:hypothetical protein